MFWIRLLTIPLLLLSQPFRCLGDQKDSEASAVQSTRSSIEPYVNWLPENSQTLVVSQRSYQIPEQLDEDASFATLPLDTLLLERQLTPMFRGDAREVLAGKRIRLSIEAASRFYFPRVPDEVENFQTVGVSQRYDGCHIFVFDENTPLDAAALFEKLLQQHPEPRSHIPAASRHQIERHDAISWSASPPGKRNTGRETAEETSLIEAALSIRYWIASPKGNVLVVATTRDVLAETLRKVSSPDQNAFPTTLKEWEHLTGRMPTWGMRHYPSERTPEDMSDLRGPKGESRISGFTFEIDPKADKAKLTFLDCSPELSCRLRLNVLRYISVNSLDAKYTQETTVGTLVQPLNWSHDPPDEAGRTEGKLASMLIIWLGHAFVI